MTNCLYCGEAIAEGEPFRPVNEGADRLHPECMIRMVAGSVGHQMRACRCFGGNEDDPKGASKREGALAAAAVFYARGLA